ncbi:DNA repair protein RecN [bacterium]|nr:DNA repair protein RecN [bacterium]QQR56514.1 MAG: DNA repair protein RecN [Candidatus Melainabacteria bacterium]
MLKSICIRDFALIENVSLDWHSGLNVLTGETGAGKSIVFDAINIVLGAKCASSNIRHGASKATIEAVFEPQSVVWAWLKQNELIEQDVSDKEIVVTREITTSGSRSRINGTMVNVATIQELRNLLLTFHVQHEIRTLFAGNTKLSMLDAIGDKKHQQSVEKYATVFTRYQSVKRQARELEMDEEERLRKLDFSRFQLNELVQADLQDEGEWDELEKEKVRLANLASIERAVFTSMSLLFDGPESSGDEKAAYDSVCEALRELERATRFDQSVEECTGILQTVLAQLDDAAKILRRTRESLDADPKRLDQIEDRLHLLSTIKKKYGPALSDAVLRRDKLSEEVDQLENNMDHVSSLKQQTEDLLQECMQIASKITSARKVLAAELSKQVSHELKELGMEKSQFKMEVEILEDLNANGLDKVDFYFSANPGQPLQPLAKVASGGELSRVILALKVVFARFDQVGTIIFDEIDAGTSGSVLQRIRDKLSQLASSHQILCITHQPLIASVADNHVMVHKVQSDNSTQVNFQNLTGQDKLKALATMASGSEKDSAMAFAQSLMNEAKNIKSSMGHI